jgi:hypothetical protein
VFEKVGETKALKLINDREMLKKKLSESQDAAKQYILNEKLISFDRIPLTLTNAILDVVNKELYEETAMNSATDLRSFMMM